MAPEVSDYYKAEGRERAWVAWLLAIGTLLVTIFVVLGVFYGGRWAFRKIKNNDNPAPVAVQADEQKTNKTKSDEQKSANATPSTNVPATTPATSSATSTAPVTTSITPAQAPTPTPSNTVSKSGLPNTGPGDALAVFAAVSIIGYIAHRRFLSN